MKKRAVICLLAGVLAAASLSGCGSFDGSDVVVTVDDKEITPDLANFLARYTQAQYETYYAGYLGDDMWNSEGSSDGESYEDTVKDSVLESLENMYLMEDHMGDYDIALTEEEENSIKEAAKQFDENNGLEEKEKVSGNTDTVERILELMTIQKKVQDAVMAGADTEVSDEEAAQKKMQYVTFSFTTTDEEGNSSEMTDEEKAELKTQAEEFAAGAAGASDFSAYASQQGYEAVEGTFDSESTGYPEELVAEMDKLEEGGTTGVVESTGGYYVARVTSLFDREATDTKKTEIVQERQQKLLDDTISEWRDDAKIDVNNRVWDKVDFNKLSVTMKQDETDPYADEVQTDDQAEETE